MTTPAPTLVSEHLFPNLTKEEQDQVRNSPAFDRTVSDMVQQGIHQNVGELIDRLFKSGQFENELEGLSPQPDYEAAADYNNVEVVDGSQDVFFFRWSDLTTVDVSADHTSMIDWKAFARSQGIDLDKYRWDTANDEPVADTPENAQNPDRELAPGLLYPAFIDAQSWPDGKDMVAMLAQVARLEGKQELADILDKAQPKALSKLLSPHINQDFMSAQSNSDVDDAYKNACEEYSLETDNIEIYEYWAVNSDFAKRLQDTGHVVAEVFDLHVWGRTCTGQMITMDGSIQEMCLTQWQFGVDECVRKVLPEAAARIQALIDAQREQERQARIAASQPQSPSLG